MNSGFIIDATTCPVSSNLSSHLESFIKQPIKLKQNETFVP